MIAGSLSIVNDYKGTVIMGYLQSGIGDDSPIAASLNEQLNRS